MASTTAETVSPARAAPTPNRSARTGRIDWVMYMSEYAATVPA